MQKECPKMIYQIKTTLENLHPPVKYKEIDLQKKVYKEII